MSDFTQENSKKRRPINKGKPAAESLRYSFIFILVILSNGTTFNLTHVMTYPITECLLCITHSAGSGLKTERAATGWGSKRHCLHAVELSQRSGKPCANCVDSSRPQCGTDYRFLGKPAMRTRWVAVNAPNKSGRGRD